MILFCEACGGNHKFTNGEVERMVYALEADTRSDPGTFELVDGEIVDYRSDKPQCLLAWLNGSHDGEVYGEHVDSMVEGRRNSA